MDHLREDGGEIFGDLLAEDFWQALPETFGPHAHVAEALSLTNAISCSIASRVSLLANRQCCGAMLVAATGILSSTRARYTTKT
jgi:hypothetical protein